MNDFIKKLAYWDGSAANKIKKVADELNKKVKEVQKSLNYLYKENPVQENGIMNNETMKKLNQFIADKGFRFADYGNNYYDKALLNDVIQVAKDSFSSLMGSKIESMPQSSADSGPELSLEDLDSEIDRSGSSEEQIDYERPTSSTL